MANWKKVIVSGSNISDLNNDAGYLNSLNGTGVFSGSAQITLNGDIKGPADANYIGNDVITNAMINTAAAIDYTKINFAGSNIVSGSVDLSGYATTASLNSFTASYVADSASVSTRLTSAESTISIQGADLNSLTNNFNATSGSLSTRVTNLETWSSSLDTNYVTEAELTAFSSSNATYIAGISSSLETTIFNLSSSVATEIAAGAVAISNLTGELATEVAKTDAYTSSFTTTTLNVLGAASITGSFGVVGATSFGDNVIVEGNLTVNGTASFVNVEELSIKDKFITLASGSNSLTDAGIIFQAGVNAGTGIGEGPALFLEATATGTYGRMAMAQAVQSTDTSANADAYVTTTEVGVEMEPPVAPNFGGTTNGYGNIYVNSLTGDIFIYA